jgi:hypothetical protein
MRPHDRRRAQDLNARLRTFSRTRSLPGLRDRAYRHAFLEQLVESIRRIEYISVIRTRDVSRLRADPSSDLFDPLKAAVLRQRAGQIDEAFWLVFLSVYFGKSPRTGWRLARDVYGRLGGTTHWDWARISSRPHAFRQWLSLHEATLSGADGVARQFGNHRKYESLDASSPRGPAAAFETYVRWVGPPRTHPMLIAKASRQAGGDPRKTFALLYQSMTVASFGRTAKFDYLTMIGKLGLGPIQPGSTYMQGATGPQRGARLLFGGTPSARLSSADLDTWLLDLNARLQLGPHGMQVLEDALCNWQKQPRRFVPFRG